MITKLVMPKLGETMEDGILTKWLKQEGEKVEKGEALFEVTTDKATFEAESPASGFIKKIIFPADNERKIPVIQTVAYVADTMDEEIPKETGSVEQKPENEKETKASPVAKKLAKEKDIDLSKIKGTGPGGRIIEKDVIDAESSQKSAVGAESDVEIVPLTGIRKTIAQRLSQSKHDAPHYYLQIEIALDNIVKLREGSDKKYSYNDVVVKAAAKVLESFPLINSTFEAEKIKMHKKINIGIAMMIDDKLMVPVIKEPNKKALFELADEIKNLQAKGKTGKFDEKDFSGGTFTISNLGMYGIDQFTAIINPPQVGILAVGKIKEVPQVREGKIVACWLMKVNISLDHRVVDGAYGAKFLAKLKETLENPSSIMQ
ncbi:MAG: 2-oxo acid dehydrogenase subunit E2 [Elusimicrobia bacterium]|nr:2-oxo acid dehydrogenase subunit E2 [Elusimicrobiota bacterium]MBU2614633.1 2-oxo acid dehydrogenase subunit E2 [Elusimicrobiota bacterium]